MTAAERLQTYLVLDEELDTLNRSGSSLRDGGGDTTHCYSMSAKTSHCQPRALSKSFTEALVIAKDSDFIDAGVEG